MDLDLIKVIANGGSFVLVVVMFMWILFRAAPDIKTTMQHKEEMHSKAIQAMSKDARTTLEAIAESHRLAIDTIMKEFREMMSQTHSECRQEREAMLKRSDENEKLDRESRHSLASMFQSALAEIYKGRIPL